MTIFTPSSKLYNKASETTFFDDYDGVNSAVGKIVKWKTYDKYVAAVTDFAKNTSQNNPIHTNTNLVSVTTDGVVNTNNAGAKIISTAGGQGYIFPNGTFYGNGDLGKRVINFAVPQNNDLKNAQLISAVNNTSAAASVVSSEIYHENGFKAGGGIFIAQ